MIDEVVLSLKTKWKKKITLVISGLEEREREKFFFSDKFYDIKTKKNFFFLLQTIQKDTTYYNKVIICRIFRIVICHRYDKVEEGRGGGGKRSSCT